MRNDLTLQVPWYSGHTFLESGVIPQCMYVMANVIAGMTAKLILAFLQDMAVFCMQGSSAPVNSFTMWKHKSSQSHTKVTHWKIYFQLFYMSSYASRKIFTQCHWLQNSHGNYFIVLLLDHCHTLAGPEGYINQYIASLLVK